MKLSMWNLVDALQPYALVVSIQDGAATLSGIRWLTDDADEHDTVYIGRGGDFIDGIPSQVILINGRDMIRVGQARMDTVSNIVSRTFDFYRNWESKLLEASQQNNGLQLLCNMTKVVFHNPTFMVYANGYVMALSQEYPKEGVHPHWKNLHDTGRVNQQEIQSLYKYDSLPDVSRAGQPAIYPSVVMGVNYISAPIENAGILIGSVTVFELDEPLTKGMCYIMQTFVEAVKKHITSQELSSSPQTRAGFLLKDALRLHTLAPEAENDLRSLVGWREKEALILCLIEEQTDGSIVLLRHLLATLTQQCREGYCFLYEKRIVILTRHAVLPSIESGLTALISNLGEQYFRYCVSLPFYDLKHFPAYYAQNLAVLTYMPRQNAIRFTALENALSILTLQLTEKELSRTMVHPALHTLREHDENHRTQYYNTLRHFLHHERIHKDTAQSLNIHRNTLVYRLAKIEELLRLDLDNPDVREYLLLSFRMADNMYSL